MKIIENILEMISYSKNIKKNYILGFVPTMGFLHEGHLSLCKHAKKHCDKVVVSIYINPTQFGENEDLDKYPKNLENDLKLLKEINIDAVFLPNSESMYPKPYNTWINVENLSTVLCGKSRPTHFRGVTTIVCKLINIVSPDEMFMGEKDFQQIVVLKTMIKDLNIQTKIIACPIIRDYDGLALSSRNSYLSTNERKNALGIFKSLKLAQEMVRNNETDSKKISSTIIKNLEKYGFIIDYVQILNSNNLQPVDIINKNSKIFIAAKIGKTRLIDNINLF